MFCNKVLVRAAPSSAPPPPFLLRVVSFAAAAPALDLDILCCRLCRRHRLACLPQSPTEAIVVYQGCQSRVAAEVVSEIASTFPGASVGEEEELVCSGSLVARVIDCGLRSLMLEHGWRCLGESIYVKSTFSASEEKSDLCAVNVEVIYGRNDCFEFVVSPDALRFTTHQISDTATSNMMDTFQRGEEVIFDVFNFRTACTILPTLQQGYVIGFCKILPPEQCLDKFIEFCSLKHGLETNYCYHTAVKLTNGASLETQWLPSSLVLQSSGLQPAIKSSRASKAMCSLRSFIDVLKAWNFFGQNQLVIKEQMLLNFPATLPTWDKAINNLELHKARTSNSEFLDLAHTNSMAIDQQFTLGFRTPKPAVLCSSSAKSCNTKVHEVALPLDGEGTGTHTSFINCGSQSRPIALINSHKSPVTLLKPSFRRSKLAEKNKRCSSENSDAGSSNKSIHPSLQKSLGELKSSYGNPTSLSNSSLQKPDIQNYVPDVPEETETMPYVEKDVLRTKVLKTKSTLMVGKDEITAVAKIKTKRQVDKNELPAVTKQKTMPKVLNDEFPKKVIDPQKAELITKVTKVKTKPAIAKSELTSTTKAKTKPDVAKDELIAKVMDHHKRGELRLLTVADLKYFLGAKKAKVGGTKEVLIQRATELLAIAVNVYVPT